MTRHPGWCPGQIFITQSPKFDFGPRELLGLLPACFFFPLGLWGKALVFLPVSISHMWVLFQEIFKKSSWPGLVPAVGQRAELAAAV